MTTPLSDASVKMPLRSRVMALTERSLEIRKGFATAGFLPRDRYEKLSQQEKHGRLWKKL